MLAVHRFAFVHRSAENVIAERRTDIRRAVEGSEIVEAPLRDRRAKSLGMSYQPGGHEPAIRAAGNEYSRPVEPTPTARCVDYGHAVSRILVAPIGEDAR